LNPGCEAYSGLKIETLGVARIDRTVSVEIHYYGKTIFVRCLDGRTVMAPHCVSARPFNVSRELARGVHQPRMFASAGNADDCETGNYRSDRDRDNQLNGAETTGVAEGLSFHNVCLGTFHLVLDGSRGTPACCPIAMTVPVVSCAILLRFDADKPISVSVGVTCGDSKWKRASYGSKRRGKRDSAPIFVIRHGK
jgi:hypothetical protein